MNERESRDTWAMLSSGVAPTLMLPMVDGQNVVETHG